MSLTVSIDTTSSKAKAFVAYIKTLDFVKIGNQDELYPLSEEQKEAIDIGIDQLKQGDSFSHDQVMEETKKRYSNLF